MINKTGIQPGFHVVKRKEKDEPQLAVVWGEAPFMQVYGIENDSHDRPMFVDIRAEDCEFLDRLPELQGLVKTKGK